MDKEKAMQDPSSQFSNPKQILEQADLSQQDKIDILKQWDYDTREILVAEEENMRSDNGNHPDSGDLLKQIHQCLIELGEDSGDTSDENSGSQTKQG